MGARFEDVPSTYQLLAAGRIGSAKSTILRLRTDETYWSWDDAGDQQLVVVNCWPSLFIWVDLHMLLFQAIPTIVRAITELPIRLLRLGEVPFMVFTPVGSSRLYFAKVWMRISLNILLAVEALLVGCRIMRFLLRIGEVGHSGILLLCQKRRNPRFPTLPTKGDAVPIEGRLQIQ